MINMFKLSREERKKAIREMELRQAISSESIKHYSLTPRMMQVVILRSEGLTFKQIGERLGCSVSAARQSFVAAKSKVNWVTKLINKSKN